MEELARTVAAALKILNPARPPLAEEPARDRGGRISRKRCQSADAGHDRQGEAEHGAAECRIVSG